jgi:cytoskeletal protein RodZ
MNQPESQTVGEKLRQAREQKGITLQDAARATHIRPNYLDELENDHPEMFLYAAQARGFLRLYAAFLELPVGELVEQWEAPAGAKIESADTELLPDGGVSEAVDEITNPELSAEGTQELGDETDEKIRDSKTGPIIKRIQALIVGIGQNITSLGVFKKIGDKISSSKLPKLPKKEKVVEEPRILETSEEIFKEIGDALLARRQKMDLDLTDVEHFTNLKRMYLIALEDGRFADLPSTVQGRGMLNNYAQFLAMDESSVMDRYAEALQLQREERMPPPRRQAESPVSVRINLPEGVRRVLNPDLVVGSAIIIALFGFILWGATQIIGTPGGEATEAPSISEMLQITQTVTPTADLTQSSNGTPIVEDTPIPGVAFEQATQTPIATVNAAPLQLYIIANDRAYMRISVDGQEVFNGRVSPNNSYTYSGNTQITLLTGNAAALEVYFNQDYLGPLGSVGEVVNLRFAPSGLSTATPQATPTPTSQPPAVEEEMMEEGN